MARIIDYQFDTFNTATDGTRNVVNAGTLGTANDGIMYTGTGYETTTQSGSIVFTNPAASALSNSVAGMLVDFTNTITSGYPSPISHSGYGSEPANNRISIGSEFASGIGFGLYTSDGTNKYNFTDIIPYAEVTGFDYKLLAAIDFAAGTAKVWVWKNGVITLVVNDTTTIPVGSVLNTAVPYSPRIGSIRDDSLSSVRFQGTIRYGAYFNYAAFTDTDVAMLFDEPEKFFDYAANGTNHGFSFAQSDILIACPLTEGTGTVATNVAANGIGDGTFINTYTWVTELGLGDQECMMKLDANRIPTGVADLHTIRFD